MILIMKKRFIFILFLLLTMSHGYSKVLVYSLPELLVAVKKSNQKIYMKPGKYNLENLPSGSRSIDITGSNNIISLKNVYVNVPVGCVRKTYINVSGNNNKIIGGEFEDTYRNGMTEVTDFSAYNKDRRNQAYGLKGDPVMLVSGDGNLTDGIKLTVRGSFPYGYGSMYGIGADNQFGLDKRCGILITGVGNTLDHVEVQQRAFGHGIFMQKTADKTVIKNSMVEGRVRESKELYEEKNSYDLPFRSKYVMPLANDKPIPKDRVHSLCEDGIRMYKIPGSITVENCTIKKMRGGVRLYLGGKASVSGTTSVDCGRVNYNLPTEGEIIKSFGNFAYAPVLNFSLNRRNADIEMTIIPSPNASGSHNLANIDGNNHQITFHRKFGKDDSDEKRAIVVTGENSKIINKTEYSIILAPSSRKNRIVSRGSVTDRGTDNTVTKRR